MDRFAFWKWLILVALTAGSLVIVTPLDKKVKLGLDLKGGTSFTVKIDSEEMRKEIQSDSPTYTEQEVDAEMAKRMEGAQSRALEVIRNRVDNLGIAEPVIYPGTDNRIIVQLPGVDEKKRAEAEQSLKSLAFLEFRMVHEKNDELVEALFEKNAAPEGYRMVQLQSRSYYKPDPNFPDTARDRDYKRRLGQFHVPAPDFEFMLEKTDVDRQVAYRPVFVKRRRELTGDLLKSAAVDYRSLGQPVVTLQFDSKGARKFAVVTSDYAPGGARNPNPNKNRQLAIVLDGTLYSAPVIREAIFGGRAEISGSFTVAEATFLANILRAGSLPAPVKIVEKRFVAPSLGADSIKSGVRACLYGSLGVVLFMAVYYVLAGFIADLALLLNLILLPLGMIITAGFLGLVSRDSGGGGPIQLPVLTLPGIAGIALTVGMAVDANVLIFERIREESAVGKRLWSAITAGFDRAFITILDSNLTTILTAVILFIFGSGPIRGFAVTLCAGLIVSMYTALTVSKMLFGVLTKPESTKPLRMMSIIGLLKIDWIGKWIPALSLSIIVIVVSWAVMVARGAKNPASVLGVDFTGGSSVSFTFKERLPVASVRQALEKTGVKDLHIQYQDEIEAGGTSYLQVMTGSDMVGDKKTIEVVKGALAQDFPNAGLVVAQEDDVGPQVGSEMIRKAIWAVLLSLVGIIIYLAWRFEFGFAVGAIVALAHDVLVTTGVYSLCGRQISMAVIASVLTIIGYSVNDTIVIFDRIRENLRLVRNASFKEICNLSVNQTMSRTLLTSFTVMITVAMLLLFGGGSVFDFTLTLFIGIISGTYSTVYIATPIVMLWHRGRRPELGHKGSTTP